MSNIEKYKQLEELRKEVLGRCSKGLKEDDLVRLVANLHREGYTK